LTAIEQGDARAADELLPVVYQELRRLAARKISREPPGQTLQATALVHEAYIKLVGAEAQNFSGRTHFFAAAAEAMRRILIDNARRKQHLKHGGGQQKIDINDAEPAVEAPSDDLIALDEAFERLAKMDKIKAERIRIWLYWFFRNASGSESIMSVVIRLTWPNFSAAMSPARP
jgi:RNA polymerase sigma factor (TIGR02999 family)